jgi:hypothetical protein
MHTRTVVAISVLIVSAACASAPPRPTGAGSTSVLRLLRDWRGVWGGEVRDSPMGGMPYVLHVEERAEALQARMAPQSEVGLEDMEHTYELFDFDQGIPRIRFSLFQRSATQRGEVVYREELSNDDVAVFCAEEAGCDKVKLAIRRIDDQTLSFHTLVHESFHARMDVRFVSATIPREKPRAVEEEPETTLREPVEEKKSDALPIDRDIYLEERLDEDIGEPLPETTGLEDW